MRQAPGTANNTTFVTLEDETGIVNLIVWSTVSMEYRNPFLQAHLLEVGGRLQHEKGVTHVIVRIALSSIVACWSLDTPARPGNDDARCPHL